MTSKGFTGKKCPRDITIKLYFETKQLVENGSQINRACEKTGLSLSAYRRVRHYFANADQRQIESAHRSPELYRGDTSLIPGQKNQP